MRRQRKGVKTKRAIRTMRATDDSLHWVWQIFEESLFRARRDAEK